MAKKKKKKSKNLDEEKFQKWFDKYYPQVKVDLDNLRKAHDPKDKELLALRIQSKRNRFLLKADRSKKLCK